MGKSTSVDKIKFGKWGENQGASFLVEKGYQIIEQNARTPYGEIDLVAEFAGTVVFVEVKTRRSTKFGNPEEAITKLKMSHMVDSAEAYLQEHPDYGGDWQIDVIAVQLKNTSKVEIQHFENIG